MFLNALKWRIVERLDELVELSDVELDAKYPKFIEQMRIGKGYLRGADPLGRPMSVVNTRLHHKADQPAETIHRFTLYVRSFFFVGSLFSQLIFPSSPSNNATGCSCCMHALAFIHPATTPTAGGKQR